MPAALAKQNPIDKVSYTVNVLQNNLLPLPCILQLHSVFIYHIYPKILEAMPTFEAKAMLARKAEISDSLDFVNKFNEKNRGRKMSSELKSETITTDVGFIESKPLYTSTKYPLGVIKMD